MKLERACRVCDVERGGEEPSEAGMKLHLLKASALNAPFDFSEVVKFLIHIYSRLVTAFSPEIPREKTRAGPRVNNHSSRST